MIAEDFGPVRTTLASRSPTESIAGTTVRLAIGLDRWPQGRGNHPMAAYMPEHLVRRFRESGLDALFSPESREMLRRVRPRMLMFLKRLHLAGAPLMTGTDTFPSLVPGFTLIDEIGAFVEAGLSPYAALQAATTGPARFLGEYDRRGEFSRGWWPISSCSARIPSMTSTTSGNSMGS